MTRPFSLAYKQKMLERLTGKDAVSARLPLTMPVDDSEVHN
ncbi:MAG: hypothetical protein NTV05_02275 [Acidobacteria bacterium]|nr:hypothetical protein [Acidobacteriota bacterium]